MGKLMSYCTINNFYAVYFKQVLGKVEGSQFDDAKKNWHGHCTVMQFRLLLIFVITGYHSCSGVPQARASEISDGHLRTSVR